MRRSRRSLVHSEKVGVLKLCVLRLGGLEGRGGGGEELVLKSNSGEGGVSGDAGGIEMRVCACKGG